MFLLGTIFFFCGQVACLCLALILEPTWWEAISTTRFFMEEVHKLKVNFCLIVVVVFFFTLVTMLTICIFIMIQHQHQFSNKCQTIHLLKAIVRFLHDNWIATYQIIRVTPHMRRRYSAPPIASVHECLLVGSWRQNRLQSNGEHRQYENVFKCCQHIFSVVHLVSGRSSRANRKGQWRGTVQNCTIVKFCICGI